MFIRRLVILTCCLLLSCCMLFSQDLDFNPSYEYGFQGDTVTVRFHSSNFEDIGSFQFTLNWDSDLIQYLDISSDFLGSIGVNENDSDQGLLRISWFGLSEALTISESDAVFQIRFLTLGEPGDISPVFINGDPLAMEVLRLINGNFEIVDISSTAGNVEILEDFLLLVETVSNATCQNADGEITLQVSGGLPPYSFSWIGPEGFISEEEDISGLLAGLYELTVLDSLGNTLLDSMIVEQEVNDLSFGGITEESYDCGTQQTTIALSFDGGDGPYSFIVDELTFEDPVFELDSGLHLLSLIDSNNCSIDTSFEIQAIPLPMVDLGEDLLACAGETLLLESAFQANQYFWSTGDTTSSINVTEEGLYSLMVTNAQGCMAFDTVSLELQLPFKAEINVADTMICNGEAVRIEASGGNEYNWIDSSGTLSIVASNAAVVRPVYSTIYGVVVSDECFMDTAYVQVNVGQALADAGRDTSVFNGCELQLNAVGGAIYLWDDSQELSCYDCPDPIILPENSTAYSVTITDDMGCIHIDSVLVEVSNDISDLFDPINVITPNNDGDNDVLWFAGLEKFSTNNIKVFNRWGNIVYQKVGYQTDDERWDGTHKGKPLPPGEYYYVLSLVSGEIKQTLLIVRD